MNEYRFEVTAKVRFTVKAESEEQARLHAATIVDCAVAEELPVCFDALTETDSDHDGAAFLATDLELVDVEEPETGEQGAS